MPSLALTFEINPAEREPALIKAEWLIVCCSPAALGSERVNAEIDAYIRLNPQSRITLVLLAGEPMQALPTRVRGREPLTADFRPAVDGEELGVLKLAAALLGQDFGALRDAQARRERAAGLGGAALVGVLALASAGAGGYAVNAVQERRQAEALTGEAVAISVDAVVAADALAQRLAVPAENRPDVLAEAEPRLEQLFDDAPASLAQARAEMLVRFADLYERRGDGVAASARALAAVNAYERLPESARASFDYVRALMLAGAGEAEGGRVAEARGFTQRAVAAARVLRAGEPDAPRANAVLADALQQLASLEARAGEEASALALYAETVPALEVVQQGSPNDDAALADLAGALARLGAAQAASGDAPAARLSFNRVATLARARLELSAGNRAARAQLGDALYRVGQALLAEGQAEAAAEPLQESLALARAGAASEPGDAGIQRQFNERLILTAQTLAGLNRASGDLMAEAVAAARAEAQRDPAARATLAQTLTAEAERLARARNLRDARTAWREVAALHRAMAGEGASPAAAAAYERVGQLSLQQNELPAAGGAYAEAVRQRRTVLEATPADTAAKAALAATLHQVGLIRIRADNPGGARAAFVEAARLRVETAEAQASDSDAALAAADTLVQLGQLQIEPAPTAARRSFERARDLLTPVVAANPEERRYAVTLRRAEAGLRALPEDQP